MSEDSPSCISVSVDASRSGAWWLLGSLLLLLAGPVSAAILTGSIGSHDPSRMTNCNGKYYIYSTGGSMMTSTDRINWTSGTSPFPSGVPTSVKNLLPSNQGIWAPDVIFLNNKYYLYYAVASSDGTQSAIGLLTSPTLDPSNATYHWTDAGIVVSDHDKVDLRTSIDPCPFLDASGELWMSFGSGYANGATWSDPTIFIMKLDDTTGLASSSNTELYPVALGHIEASYIDYHNGYYYAFWNSGGCCSGNASTYTVHVARSPTVEGPYVDKNGATDSSVTFLAATVLKNSVNGNEYGPGQVGFLSEGGIDRVTYHYYPQTGGSVVGEETVIWGSDGWPAVGSDFVPGTYKIVSVGANEVIGVPNGNLTNGAPTDWEIYANTTFQHWTVAFTTASSGADDGYYSIISVGSGKAIDLYQSSAANGTLIDQWTANLGNNQRWFIEQTSDGHYHIVSRSSGKVIAVPTFYQNPALQIAKINNGADVQVTFPSQVGWTYNVLSATNLLQAWTKMTTLAGTGGNLTYVDTGAGSEPQCYWRLQITEALDSWAWLNTPDQEWTLSAP